MRGRDRTGKKAGPEKSDAANVLKACDARGVKGKEAVWRLFAGLEFPEAEKRRIHAAGEVLLAGLDFPMSRVAPENLHITLAFIGNLEPGAAEVLVRRFAAFRAVFPRPLTLGAELAFFPGGKRAFPVFFPVIQGEEGLLRLHADLAVHMGWPPETFHPHLTLARIRKPVRRFPDGRREAPLVVYPSALTLFRSLQVSGGVVHLPLVRALEA